MNKERRLTIRSLGQFLDRTVQHDIGQVSSKNLIRFPKQIRRDRKLVAQIPSHSDGLGALAGEQECDLLHQVSS